MEIDSRDRFDPIVVRTACTCCLQLIRRLDSESSTSCDAAGSSPGYWPAQTPRRRTTASMLCLSSAVVKPHQALDASLTTTWPWTTDQKTAYSAGTFTPRQRYTPMTYR